MPRRYYKLIVEIDDVPESELSGHVTTPGVPTITRVSKLGVISTMLHTLFRKKAKQVCDTLDHNDVVMEVPNYVDASQLFDIDENKPIRCCLRSQSIKKKAGNVEV